MKKVVTGEHEGVEKFVASSEVRDGDGLVTSGIEIWGLWGQDGLPALPFRGGEKFASDSFHPGPGDIRVNLIRFGADLEEDSAEGSADPIQALMDEDGMHSTDTCDIGWMISGELGMELANGEVVWFQQGDLMVQNGTRHRWLNRSGEPALVGWVVIGAEPDSPAPERPEGAEGDG